MFSRIYLLTRLATTTRSQMPKLEPVVLDEIRAVHILVRATSEVFAHLTSAFEKEGFIVSEDSDEHRDSDENLVSDERTQYKGGNLQAFIVAANKWATTNGLELTRVIQVTDCDLGVCFAPQGYAPVASHLWTLVQ